MADRDYFINYIIKTLVRGIEHHTIDGEFVVSRMSVTDEIIKQIVDEGERYEYSEKETRELIANIAENISWYPSVENITSCLNVYDLDVGTHVVLSFDDKQYGLVELSLICIYTGDFFVIYSQIPGIIYHDRLKIVNPIWSINHPVEFVPYRYKKKILNDNQVLRFDQLVSIDINRPSVIHEIYDSKTDSAKASKQEKSLLLSFLIDEIDRKTINGSLEKDYPSILEDGSAVGISSYTTNLLAKTAVRQTEKSPEIDNPFLPASFIYSHLSTEEQNTINELESEIKRLKKLPPIVKKQRGRTALLLTSIILFLVLGFMFLGAASLAIENSDLFDTLAATRDSLNTIVDYAVELEDNNNSLSQKLEGMQRIKYVAGSTKRYEVGENNSDKNWVEWFDVKYPVRIESFFTFASQSGNATVVAYDLSNKKIAEYNFTATGGQWQKISLKNFVLSEVGMYYFCVENTSISFGYHRTNNGEYSSFKQGALHVIGASSRKSAESANRDSSIIVTNYYQYFYSIQYSLL